MSFNLDRNWADQQQMREFVLDQVRVYAKLPIDSYLWREHQISYFEAAFGDLVVQLESFVLQDKLPPKALEEVFYIEGSRYPVTWWDHFKVTKLEQGRWYWRWLGKLKEPQLERETFTRNVRVNLERWVSYPEAQVVGPEFGKAYRGYTLTREKR